MTHASAEFKVLLVEDKERHHSAYKAAIEDALPVQVVAVTTAAAAMEALATESFPDLVLLDLQLPDASGKDVLLRIKSDLRLRFVPVIILTGRAGFDIQMELLEAGADDFIEKGDAPEILVARLKAQMRHKLATDRLERLAFERDLFAANVLSDISHIKSAILVACRQVNQDLDDDLLMRRGDIEAQLDRLTSIASKLGSYAADVIQSVRDTNREPSMTLQELPPLLDWINEVLIGEARDERPTIAFQMPQPLMPVFADLTFLRLVLLSISKFALAGRQERNLQITVTQTKRAASASQQREQIVTHLTVASTLRAEENLEDLFRPSQGASEQQFKLGLSLVPKVMVRMGGEAWVQHGNTTEEVVFCLALPASQRQA